MRNEVKIGILAIVSMALSFWGYKFILGKNMLAQSNFYKVYYDNANRIQIGTEVIVSGVKVGIVNDIQLQPDQRVLVTLDLQKSIKVPKDAKAIIIATNMMGGKGILLDYDKICSGPDCAKSGDILEGRTWGMMASMFGKQEMEEYVGILKEGLNDIIDTLNKQMVEGEDSKIGKSIADIQQTLSNLKSATGTLNQVIAQSSGDITGTLDNLESITGSLDDNKSKIENIISNADSFSSNLAELDLKTSMEEIKTTIDELKTTLSSANTLIGDINEGNGSLGKLIKDETLYNNLNRLSTQADSLLSDFQNKPYRYMPLKSKRKVEKYDKQE